MTIDEAIKHCEEVAEKHEKMLNEYEKTREDRPLFSEEETECRLCAIEHWQLAMWLEELKVFKSRKGEWLRITDEPEDDRYKCSHCGNVVHYKDKMDLYTFNKWCGRCGSDNSKKNRK